MNYFLNKFTEAKREGVPETWLGVRVLTMPTRHDDNTVTFNVKHKYSTRTVVATAEFEADFEKFRGIKPDTFVNLKGVEHGGMLAINSVEPYSYR